MEDTKKLVHILLDKIDIDAIKRDIDRLHAANPRIKLSFAEWVRRAVQDALYREMVKSSKRRTPHFVCSGCKVEKTMRHLAYSQKLLDETEVAFCKKCRPDHVV